MYSIVGYQNDKLSPKTSKRAIVVKRYYNKLLRKLLCYRYNL